MASKPRSASARVLEYRCQVDIIEMRKEQDEEYRFIMNYQEYITRFTVLRPLETDSVEEISRELLSIFGHYGAPYFLTSNKGRDFCIEVCECLAELYPGLQLVYGEPRYSYAEFNDHVGDKLAEWMTESNTKKWVNSGLACVQSKINSAVHPDIGMTPFQAVRSRVQRLQK